MFKTKGEKREETHKQIEQLAAAGRFEEAYECYPFISYGRIFITLLICEAVGAFLTYCGYWLMVNPYASNFLQILGGGWMIVFFIGLFVSPFATAKPMFRIKRKKEELKRRLRR